MFPWWRADAWNICFINCLGWPIYMINWVDKTKLWNLVVYISVCLLYKASIIKNFTCNMPKKCLGWQWQNAKPESVFSSSLSSVFLFRNTTSKSGIAIDDCTFHQVDSWMFWKYSTNFCMKFLDSSLFLYFIYFVCFYCSV